MRILLIGALLLSACTSPRAANPDLGEGDYETVPLPDVTVIYNDIVIDSDEERTIYTDTMVGFNTIICSNQGELSCGSGAQFVVEEAGEGFEVTFASIYFEPDSIYQLRASFITWE